MFEVKCVSKKYKREYALRDLSMKIGGGLNFIVGPSGSGKTTLLKILSGMDSQYEGTVLYNSENIKTVSGDKRSQMYGQRFGFIWQDFNLLEDRTVKDNVLLPSYLGSDMGKGDLYRILREMKIASFADRKVSALSGGQKQRVAIARELMKAPQVIFADEPTSALDKRSAAMIMAVLRNLSRRHTVIVVTHDRSLIDGSSCVYELDKGTLSSSSQSALKPELAAKERKKPRLSAGRAFKLGFDSAIRNPGHTIALLLTALVASTLMLSSFGSTVASAGQAELDKLYASYGDQLMDLSLDSSFIGAGSNGNHKNNDPDVNVNQDLSGLYNKYAKDDRVAMVMLSQAFQNINITVGGTKYSIKTTNNVPVMNKLITGSLPSDNDNEVAVPDSFVKRMGISNKQAIGKTIDFHGSIYVSAGQSPKEAPVSMKAKIVGVFNPEMRTSMEGKVLKMPIDDSFFFSLSALQQMRTSAGLKSRPIPFTLRAKNPKDLISLKDELNAAGIVPLGQFKLVENLVKINDETHEQSDSAKIIMAALSLLAVIAVAFIGAFLRRREFAIFKVSGYIGRSLVKVVTSEFLLIGVATSVAFCVVSPVTNSMVSWLLRVSLLRVDLIIAGMLVAFCLCALAYVITVGVAGTTKPSDALRQGGR